MCVCVCVCVCACVRACVCVCVHEHIACSAVPKPAGIGVLSTGLVSKRDVLKIDYFLQCHVIGKCMVLQCSVCVS